jgi:hypothetical protein
MAAPIVWTEARKNGTALKGIKKGEDTFTLHLMDAQRKWQLLSKRE